MRIVITVLFSVVIIGCNDGKRMPNTFKNFDFSFNNTFSDCFSIKFTAEDTVYIKQHFASAFSDSLKSGKSYYAILSPYQKEKLDSFLIKIDFKKFDTTYYESYADGVEYAFFIKKDSIKRRIYVHSDSTPSELKALAFWIVNLKKELTHVLIDTLINFESLKNFLPPRTEPPALIFKTPKVE